MVAQLPTPSPKELGTPHLLGLLSLGAPRCISPGQDIHLVRFHGYCLFSREGCFSGRGLGVGGPGRWLGAGM